MYFNFNKFLNILLSILFLGFESLASPQEYSLSELNLAKIVQRQQDFFKYAEGLLTHDEEELTKMAQDIVSSYERHLAENQNDVHALILFGKFLQKVDQKDRAIDYFLRADVINPKLAVVKQQMGNYLVQKGRIVDAFPFYMLTVRIAPDVPNYHFEIGSFIHLFLDDLVDAEIVDQESGMALSHRSFKEATTLAPQTFEYALRYAQSFFDYPSSDKRDALAQWDALLENFTDLSKAEVDYVNLCKARILIELKRKEEARILIQGISTESLSESKLSILRQIVIPKPKKKVSEDSGRPNPKIQTEGQLKTGFVFPTDEHLFRMSKVSQRLREEKLLSELRLDVFRAHLNEEGKIRIEFSANSDP